MENYKDFKVGLKVKVAEEYLNDEVTQDYDTSPIARIIQEPKDSDQLVMVQYKSGSFDYIPQSILTIIETNFMELTLLEIIVEFRGSDETEPLDGDDVDRLTKIISTKINYYEGNITEDEYNKLLG